MALLAFYQLFITFGIMFSFWLVTQQLQEK